MSKRSAPGSSVVARLSGRNQGGLYRRQLPGGGEVFSGPTATQALRSLGARAFTMDNTIFVAEDFDPSSTEDQALYAHERHHQLNSGGDGAAESYHDAEELAARAIESMVLHRADQGEDFGSIMRDVEENRISRAQDAPLSRDRRAGPGPTSEAKGTGNPDEDAAAAAYVALINQGREHLSIVRELRDHCVQILSKQKKESAQQGGSTGFI